MNFSLELRKLCLSDATSMARLANNKKIWDNVRDIFPHPYSEKDAESFIKTQDEDDLKDNFAIECNGDFCGAIGLILEQDVYRKSAEIGYWVGEPYWGKGVATRAVDLLARYAFDELGLVRLYAGVFEYNRGSMRVLEKNGFIKEGISKKAVFKNDRFWDEHCYALIR